MDFNRAVKIKALLIFTLVIIAAVFLFEPVAQDPSYHQFADVATRAGIPNIWNVLSNIPFVVVGLIGLIGLNKQSMSIWRDSNTMTCHLFFIGMIFTGIGSAFYHLAPTNESLLWDRLPMTISFMAFLSLILSLHIDKQFGARALWPLITLGLLSVMYWAYTESIGEGDLRFYAVIQFLPMVIIPMVMFLFPQASYKQTYIWMVIALYAAAKALELYDNEIYQLLNISGHSLKHIIASLAGIAILQAIRSTIHR